MNRYWVRMVGQGEGGNWDIVELDFNSIAQIRDWLIKHSCRTGTGFLYEVISIYDNDEGQFIDIPQELKVR